MILRKLIISTGLCLLWNLSLQASQVDSLNQLFKKTIDPTEKTTLAVELSKAYRYHLPEEQLNFAQQAEHWYHKSRLKNDSLLIEIFCVLGTGLADNGEVKQGLFQLNQGLRLAKKYKLESAKATIYNIKGTFYDELGRIDKAIENYQYALEITEKTDNNSLRAICLNNIGIIYFSIGELEKAEQLLTEHLEICEAENDLHGVAISYINLGDIEKKRGKIDKAIRYYLDAYSIVDSLKVNYDKILIKVGLGELYSKKEQANLAVQYYTEGYNMALEYGFKEEIGEAALGLAKWQMEQKNHQKSIAFAQKALQFTDELDSKGTASDLHQCLSKNYEALGDYQQALFHHQQAEILQDSLYSQKRLKTFAELEYRFATEKRASENKFLKEEQAKSKTIIRQQSIISIVVIILLILTGFAFWVLLRQNNQKQEYNDKLQKQVEERTKHLQDFNNQLTTANQELEQFAYITSHDLKEPLRNIAGFSSLIQRKLSNGEVEGLEEYLKFINSSTHQMSNLIEDILSYSKVGNEENCVEVSLAHLLNQAKNDLQLTLQERNGQIQYIMPSLRENASQILLPAQLSLVFKNLIENGIKYNKNNEPTVKIGYYNHEKHHILTFKDNGFGIEKEYQEKVFEMFKRLHHRGEYQGSGIGLSICKKVALTLGGTLKIISSNQKGTMFELKIPMKEQNTKAEESEKESLKYKS